LKHFAKAEQICKENKCQIGEFILVFFFHGIGPKQTEKLYFHAFLPGLADGLFFKDRVF
jgi:hypothetical protein